MAAALSICASASSILGKRVVLTGSLGPLLYDATAGSMDVQFEKIAGGTQGHDGL